MTYRPDLAVYSSGADLQAVVEVKALPGKGPEWAAQFRRNLVAHQMLPNVPYFVIALPDNLYLWKDGNDSSERRPDLTLQTPRLLQQFCSRQIEPGLTATALEIYILDLFQQLAALEPGAAHGDLGRALSNLGFVDAIHGGTIKAQVAP